MSGGRLRGPAWGIFLLSTAVLSAGSVLAQEAVVVRCSAAGVSNPAAASEINNIFKIDYAAQTWSAWDSGAGAWVPRPCNREYGSGADVVIWTCDFSPLRFVYNKRDGAFIEYELLIDRTNGAISYRASNHRDGSSYTGGGSCASTPEPTPPRTIF